MEGSYDVDVSNSAIMPLWKRRSANHAGSRDPSKPKARPLSYQIDGVTMTDFPVEDRCAFTLTQPAEKIVASPGGSVVLKHVMSKPTRAARVVRSISIGRLSNGKFSFTKRKSEDHKQVDNQPPQTLEMNKNSDIGSSSNEKTLSPDNKSDLQRRLSSPLATLTKERDQVVFSSDPGDLLARTAHIPSNNNNDIPFQQAPQVLENVRKTSVSSPVEKVVHQRQLPTTSQSSDKTPSVVLSTNSPAALKMGIQQLIPKALASKVTKSNQNLLDPNKRTLHSLSMVETCSSSFFPFGDAERETDSELDSPGTLKRGLRTTSYRRAVVSGIDFDGASPNGKKGNRLSHPILRSVEEDKEKSSSLGKGKKGLPTQGTFDSEEDAVLYQNYKEKALHNDSDEDAEPKEQKSDERIVVQYKPLRSTWGQLSVVRKSEICQQLSQEERKRQETIFEVISSEHSYLHSLEILIRLFKNSSELNETMTKTENHHLFSNIADVCEASKKFFKELEDRHQQNIVIDDVSDIVEKHATSTFDPYVKYCSNEVYQQRTLQKLLTKNPSFKEVLSRIESNPDCRNLPMISFLILPMQRVTRLPLLMDTICQKTAKDSHKYELCKSAFKAVSKLVRLCNEGARTMERTEMMYTINSQLEFKIKPFPLVSSSRWMVKRGELTAFVEDNGIFLKRTSRQQVYFFLFNDVLIVTRRKSEESYNVIDYALRDQLSVGQCEIEELNLSPVKTTSGMLYSRQGSANHVFTLAFTSNHSGEKVTMIMGAEFLNERARWITALGENSSDKQSIDRTTLTQVEITRTYTAKQPDELSLQVADVVLVYQKVNDGWYEGERLRDGERGWFLSECAMEITCQATIEKNMERMGRLLGLETNV
ncbi:rho guanine nucleotide exchange factor 26-like isoform X2 [Polyodon spathula]|uniref:rho guanine nucleotide exchange factor 26-like isoform X2 n=1 Tax=Polyodon spathula TaxID=7913 RepID=UPI001B7DD3EC|nr:rho guanine nucleotide exchange factor 26-like isoform X2 [Polyodon spathula]